MSHEHCFNSITSVRGLFPLENKPGVISLLPHDAMFPSKSLSLNIASHMDPAQEQSISLSGKDLAAGLQYTPSGDLPRLPKWFIGLQALSHGRKSGEGWSLFIGSGSQDLIYKVRISLNLNRWFSCFRRRSTL